MLAPYFIRPFFQGLSQMGEMCFKAPPLPYGKQAYCRDRRMQRVTIVECTKYL